jgi:3-methyladenine DNA glycosylase AlkD
MSHPLSIEIVGQLQRVATEEKRRVLSRFFKTGRGQYGEGDRFLGVPVPLVRAVVKRYREAPLAVVDELLSSVWHECRLCALLILVDQYRRAESVLRKDGKKSRQSLSPERRTLPGMAAEATPPETYVQFYLAHTAAINNWDLVDLSAPYLLGDYLLTRPRDLLYTLSCRPHLWEQRIAMVATLGLIRAGDCRDALRLAAYFAAPARRPLHDLLQKAAGWMLREVGKRDRDALVDFLEEHAATMPRTMLRYAIEKMSADERRRWMSLGSPRGGR